MFETGEFPTHTIDSTTESARPPLETKPKRVDLFPKDIDENPLWFHGTHPYEKVKQIELKGLKPPHSGSPTQSTLARRISFSADPSYSGGFGAILGFHLKDSDRLPSSRDMASISYDLESIPPDRIMFIIPGSGGFSIYDKEIKEAAARTLAQGTAGFFGFCRTELANLQKKLATDAEFPDETKRTPENITRFAQEILWNELEKQVFIISDEMKVILNIIRELRTEIAFSSLEQLNDLIKKRTQGRYYIENTDEFIQTVLSLIDLPQIQGSGFENVNFTNFLGINKEADEFAWLRSLPQQLPKEDPSPEKRQQVLNIARVLKRLVDFKNRHSSTPI